MPRANRAKRYAQGKLHASLASASRIADKIKSGDYGLEDAPCFCGGRHYVKVANADRYSIPVSIVVCQECALVRLNPRPTRETYARFYNEEYRTLNHARYLSDICSFEEEQEALWNRQVRKGEALTGRLIEHAIETPKVVVDYGSHLGGMLFPFKKLGAELWGIEIDTQAHDNARARVPGLTMVSSIEELALRGVKADLVIAQDMVEHFTDLREIEKIGQIMTPQSVLFVWTPGLFRVRAAGNFQIAHTHYFCANTLHYVMNELGFVASYVDEECESFWHYRGRQDGAVSSKPKEWVEFVMDEIAGKDVRKLPPFSGVCKFTKKELYDNIEKNLAQKPPDLIEITGTRRGAVVIISGGPSIDGQIDEIKKAVDKGAAVIAIARMYPWCAEQGIRPDYVVSLDCSEDQEKGFAKIQPGVTYLLSNVTRPSIMEMLERERVYVFDSRDDPMCKQLRFKAGYSKCTVVNGGGSVSVLALSLAFNLGFSDLHVFGMDSMLTDAARHHSEGISGTSVELRLIPVEIDGQEYITTPQWIEFARQALDLIGAAHEEGMLSGVKFYGESLINQLWDGRFDHEEAAA